MKPYVKAELKPGPDTSSDADLLAFCRASGATIFHPSGTCRMGHDEQAVVDDQLRVRGLQGLRVADCSIMPTLVSGNTNAAAIMVAEKAAQMMMQARDA
jgi:choline dehydrogenase